MGGSVQRLGDKRGGFFRACAGWGLREAEMQGALRTPQERATQSSTSGAQAGRGGEGTRRRQRGREKRG